MSLPSTPIRNRYFTQENILGYFLVYWLVGCVQDSHQCMCTGIVLHDEHIRGAISHRASATGINCGSTMNLTRIKGLTEDEWTNAEIKCPH